MNSPLLPSLEASFYTYKSCGTEWLRHVTYMVPGTWYGITAARSVYHVASVNYRICNTHVVAFVPPRAIFSKLSLLGDGKSAYAQSDAFHGKGLHDIVFSKPPF